MIYYKLSPCVCLELCVVTPFLPEIGLLTTFWTFFGCILCVRKFFSSFCDGFTDMDCLKLKPPVFKIQLTVQGR